MDELIISAPIIIKLVMRKIVYYVAASIDGFICGPAGDISGFVAGGDGVDRYVADLADFDTVIMGRNTYEFGYRFGLKPGQPAYAHMEHYIFSNHLELPEAHAHVHVKPLLVDEVLKIRQKTGSDIYLCGGGQFAGWLLDNGMVDILKIKLNPFVQGQGVRIFGDSKRTVQTALIDSAKYGNGLQIMTYSVLY
jgi:dihydrofolate reductase